MDTKLTSCSADCLGMTKFSRRTWLSTASALAGGSWLTLIAEELARAADQKPKPNRPRSLLMIWLQGGPSQLETFDPHPGRAIGGETRAIRTSVAGLEIASTMPRTAEQMHRACLVRSVVSKEGDHERATYHLKTGWRPEPTIVHPSIGAVICHQMPSNLEIPRHISILSGQWPARAGYLGAQYDSFQIGDPRDPIPNLLPRVSQDRLQARVGTLLNTFEDEFRRGRMKDMDRIRTQHQTATKRAVSMMSSQQLAAFEIDREPDSTRASFGDHPFSRGCLSAVRLLQAGVRCVEVELGGWDTHINNHELQSDRAAILDAALAATLEELQRRELLDQTVVFCGGEFGRTPKINPAGGRDHWPHGFSVLLAGADFRRGHIHGKTSADPDLSSENPQRFTDAPVKVPDLHATMLSALGIRCDTELITPIGRPLRLSDGEVVSSLLTTQSFRRE